jgi:hypothetical protein
MSLRTSFLRSTRVNTMSTTRPLSSTSRVLAKDAPPPPNVPPGARQAGRTDSPANDKQSSASSSNTNAEQQTGDNHPAKQPDPQQASDRSTGFHEIDHVEGGKAGLGARTDKKE